MIIKSKFPKAQEMPSPLSRTAAPPIWAHRCKCKCRTRLEVIIVMIMILLAKIFKLIMAFGSHLKGKQACSEAPLIRMKMMNQIMIMIKSHLICIHKFFCENPRTKSWKEKSKNRRLYWMKRNKGLLMVNWWNEIMYWQF